MNIMTGYRGVQFSITSAFKPDLKSGLESGLPIPDRQTLWKITVCLFIEPGIESPDARLRAGDGGLGALE